jgi:hypothetical protein
MEAARTSETSVNNYFTRQYVPEVKSELVLNDIYKQSERFGNIMAMFFLM